MTFMGSKGPIMTFMGSKAPILTFMGSKGIGAAPKATNLRP
jgi:hypothetical protein